MIKLTLATYYTMPHEVRTALRRKAFGLPRPLPPQLEGQFDLRHLRTILVQENEETGDFGTKWTNTADDLADLAEESGPRDVVDFIAGVP